MTPQSGIAAPQAVRDGDDPLAQARLIAARSGLALMADEDWPDRIDLPPALSVRFLRSALMLPVGPDPATGAERVALADPANRAATDALRAALGKPLSLRIASVPALLSRLESLAEQASGAAEMAEPAETDSADDSALDAPTVALLDKLLARAVETRATDLHFEPGPQQMTIRQRVDGMLRVVMTVPAPTGRALVARLKILAGLNIAERRLAQDGHLRVTIGKSRIDMRCATLPMVDGEGAALRILAGRARIPRIDALGLLPAEEAALRHALAQSHGLILVTGPTGSGKTTTLAAATSALNDPSRKIISVEDPVEYHIAGVSQVQVNPAIGLDFAAGLRAFMRADPDVLLVGEVRDRETAAVTVQAALTGHLVLTTLHTNSAAGAVVRLTEMGIERYLLAATLRLSIGQRLVRQLCPHCRAPEILPALPFAPEIRSMAGHAPTGETKVWNAVGCDHCGGTGYYGRSAIFEVLALTEPLRQALLGGAGTSELHAAGIRAGMVPLLAAGLRQVLAGQTSVAELLRVVQDD
ncbi:GspE/PulE family protein [Paragemmobacter straminiformis]|uniref:Type II/IV secretion system protein n=1 Tax=Paragemmobacter straminiformis TaxID=2045119 RepID=A0A842IBR7_9RHOB|nr:GspE/PulE family protein [Gemmobacter straminiformis]MBC2836544.1 type II/IV secretion system protein [Gemmobacter straminiformis]